MSTRRRFLYAASGAIASAAIPFGFAGRVAFAQAARTRLPVMSTDPDIAAKAKRHLQILGEGIRLMRAKDSTNPLSYEQQKEIHADDTLRMHGCWRFFPWHRVQLACFEAIIANLTGASDFALPYWNPREHKTLPAEFFTPASPLHNKRRFAGVTANTDFTGILEAMGPNWATRMDTDFTTFHGGPEDEDFGAVDSHTHGKIHTSVGGRKPTGERGDFSVTSTATLDPVFWVHHANVDRIWDSWLQKYRSATHFPANFLDEPLEEKIQLPSGPVPALKTIDVMAAATMPHGLGYAYDRPYRLDSFAIPPPPKGWIRERQQDGTSESNGAVANADGSAAVRVPIEASLRPGTTGDKQVHLARCRALIRVKAEGLDDYDLRIYIDKEAKNGRRSVTDETHCDSLAPFGAGHHAAHGDRTATLRINATQQVAAAFKNGATDGVSVIVEPVSKAEGYKPTSRIAVVSVSLESTVIHRRKA